VRENDYVVAGAGTTGCADWDFADLLPYFRALAVALPGAGYPLIAAGPAP
jgi:choline dehydrogenase-like flavoprotein